MKKIDTRGLSCPEPVLRTRQELEKMSRDEPLDVLVDTVTARENVTRAAKSLGREVEVEQVEGDYLVHISGGGKS